MLTTLCALLLHQLPQKGVAEGVRRDLDPLAGGPAGVGLLGHPSENEKQLDAPQALPGQIFPPRSNDFKYLAHL